MVFLKIGFGFLTGVTISSYCHEYIYLSIVNGFLSPHWRYKRKVAEMYSTRHALDTRMLNIYMIDIASSFFMFWVMIGPIAYQVYVKKEPVQTQESPNEVEDTYASMLKKLHKR